MNRTEQNNKSGKMRVKVTEAVQHEFKINLFLVTLLWHTGYFELMAVKTLWAPEKLLLLS